MNRKIQSYIRVGLVWAVTAASAAGAAHATEDLGLQAAAAPAFIVENSPPKIITLGSADPKSGFEFQLELSSQGAAVRRVTFSGFDDRVYKNLQPLAILSPVKQSNGSEIMSLANTNLVFVQQQLQLPLDKLSWKSYEVETAANGSQAVRFEAVVKGPAGEPVLKLLKTYKITPGSFYISCDLSVENLFAEELKTQIGMNGPAGIGMEGLRGDARKVVAGFKNPAGQVTGLMLDISKFNAAGISDDKKLAKNSDTFLWAAVVNKYFGAIMVPVPDEGKSSCDWIKEPSGWFYNPNGIKADGDEQIGINFKTVTNTLAPSGRQESTRKYGFGLYVGPKDKRLFDKNELYRTMGFINTIDFMPCFCCPAAVINPLAFGILAAMGWMYRFIPNYGVVIIILVFFIRLALHPLTKKSQVSMAKMSKLAPKAEEIKKKYANDKNEMNRQLMLLYKEHGASPIFSMLPMFAQMPIWIALYGAIYASIELRGAAFLPFWITDLSAPDALVRFATVTIPLLGWKVESLNLLPLLMGVAFYLQQKLTPTQAAAPADSQAAQQQKMMMIMMPILFPLMLYNAPSGLNLYIMASTFAGVVEQYVIKKHIREKEEQAAAGMVAVTSKTGGKVKKKKPKPFYKS